MIYFCGGLPTGFEGNPKSGNPSGCAKTSSLVLSFLLLGEKDGGDVGEDSTLSDGDVAEELVQLFVVADGELDVPWDYARPLVVLGGVAGELEQLGGQVLEDGGEVDRGSRTDTLGESPLAEKPRHAADGELQTCSGGPRGGTLLAGTFLAHLEIGFFA